MSATERTHSDEPDHDRGRRARGTHRGDRLRRGRRERLAAGGPRAARAGGRAAATARTRPTSAPTSSTRAVRSGAGWPSASSCLAYTGLPLAAVKLRWQGERQAHAAARGDPLGAAAARARGAGRARLPHAGRPNTPTSAPPRCCPPAAGVYTFHHDPGLLSAAFVWPRTVRTLLSPPPKARYVIGGWSALVTALEGRARELGVTIETGHDVSELPESSPVIVATELDRARELLGGRLAALDERAHGLSRPRPASPPRRPVRRVRPGRGRLDRALHRPRPLAGARRARSSCRRRCRSAPERAPSRPSARLERLLDASLPTGASARPGVVDR